MNIVFLYFYFTKGRTVGNISFKIIVVKIFIFSEKQSFEILK